MIEKLVEEIKKIVRFKETTGVGDIILIVIEEPQALLYGMVTEIERDVTRKDEWWHLSFHILAVPPQKTTWTLRSSQFTGEEIFTMGGEKRFIKALDFGVTEGGKIPGGQPGGGNGKPKLRVLK